MRSTFTNLANMFRVPDLRNKVLFTLLVIMVYRLGSNIPCPGVSWPQVKSLEAEGNHAGVVGFLALFSGGALTKFAVFGLGIMPYITASIIIQLMIVVIPKFEQWREEGAVGQKKLTQVTRYLTIALAIMQSTGLAYVFHNGGGGLFGVEEAQSACIRMLESGPAAGVIGTKALCDGIGLKNAIAFDMGGTTAKAGVIHDGEPLTTGLYRLTFGTGAYYGEGKTFFPEVTIAFEVSDASQHYHVPLLLSPFGYSTYRGT